MSEQFGSESAGKRQHTVSLPRRIFDILEKEARARGLASAGEMNRAIVRCWIENRPGPPRTGAAVAEPVAIAPAGVPPPPRTAPAPPVMAPALVPKYQAMQQEAVRQPDPDFDSQEALAEARALLAQTDVDGVPF